MTAGLFPVLLLLAAWGASAFSDTESPASTAPTSAPIAVALENETVKLILFPDVAPTGQDPADAKVTSLALEAALVDLARLPSKAELARRPPSASRVALPAAVVTMGPLTTPTAGVQGLRSQVDRLNEFTRSVDGVGVAALLFAADAKSSGSVHGAYDELSRIGSDHASAHGVDRYLDLGVGYCAVVLSAIPHDGDESSDQLAWLERRLTAAAQANRSCVILCPSVDVAESQGSSANSARSSDLLMSAFKRHADTIVGVIQAAPEVQSHTSASAAAEDHAVHRLAVSSSDGISRCLTFVTLPSHAVNALAGECRAAPILKLFLRKRMLLITPVANRTKSLAIDTSTCSFRAKTLTKRPPLAPLCREVFANVAKARRMTALAVPPAPSTSPAAADTDATTSNATMGDIGVFKRRATVKPDEVELDDGDNATSARTRRAVATSAAADSSEELDTDTTRAPRRSTGNATSAPRIALSPVNVTDINATVKAPRVSPPRSTQAPDSTSDDAVDVTTRPARHRLSAFPSNNTRGQPGPPTTVAGDQSESGQADSTHKPTPRSTSNATADPDLEADAPVVTRRARRMMNITSNTTTNGTSNATTESPLNDQADANEGNTTASNSTPRAPRPKPTTEPTSATDAEANDVTTRIAKRRTPVPTTSADDISDAKDILTDAPEARIRTLRPSAPANTGSDEDAAAALEGAATPQATRLASKRASTEQPDGAIDAPPETTRATAKKSSAQGSVRGSTPSPAEDGDSAPTSGPAAVATTRSPRSTAPETVDSEDVPSSGDSTLTTRVRQIVPTPPRTTDDQGDEPTHAKKPASTESSESDLTVRPTKRGAAVADTSSPAGAETTDAVTATDAPTETESTPAPPLLPPAGVPAEDASTQFVNLFNIMIVTLIVVPSLALVARIGSALGVSSENVKALAGNHALSPALRAIIDVFGLVISCASVLFVFGSFAYNKWRQRHAPAAHPEGQTPAVRGDTAAAGATSPGGAVTSDGDSTGDRGSSNGTPGSRVVAVSRPMKLSAASPGEAKRPALKGKPAGASRVRNPEHIPLVAVPAGEPSSTAGSQRSTGGTRTSDDGWESDW